LSKLLGTTVNPRFESDGRGDVRHSLASIEKASLGLGYAPSIGFEEGLKLTTTALGWV